MSAWQWLSEWHPCYGCHEAQSMHLHRWSPCLASSPTQGCRAPIVAPTAWEQGMDGRALEPRGGWCRDIIHMHSQTLIDILLPYPLQTDCVSWACLPLPPPSLSSPRPISPTRPITPT